MCINLRASLGFTLLELIQTIFIIGVLSILTIPNISEFQQNNNRKATRHEVLLFLKASRADAISNNSITVTCTLKENVCVPFIDKLSSFVDKNNNNKLDTDEVLLRSIKINARQIYWRRDNRPIRFMPNGHARGRNGTLTLCFGKSRGFNVVIASTGRFRIENDPKSCAAPPIK